MGPTRVVPKENSTLGNNAISILNSPAQLPDAKNSTITAYIMPSSGRKWTFRGPKSTPSGSKIYSQIPTIDYQMPKIDS